MTEDLKLSHFKIWDDIIGLPFEINYKPSWIISRVTRSNMVRNPVIETYWGPMRIQIAHQCLNFYWLLSCLGQEAEQAIQCLNGKLALSKKLVVRWAHAQVKVSLGETEGKARHPSWVSEEPPDLHCIQPICPMPMLCSLVLASTMCLARFFSWELLERK